MSLITANQLPAYRTQARVDTRINDLPMNEVEFAELTSLYGRLFGVLTGSRDGEWLAITDEKGVRKSEHGDRFTLNHCVRWQFPRIADGIVASTEAELGYALTERYHTESQPMVTPLVKFQTKFAGVDVLNVGRSWGNVYEDVVVSPYMQEDVDVVLINPGTYAARISSTLFVNPHEVFLRGTDGSLYPWFSDTTSPLRRDTLGGYWEMPLNSRVREYVPGTQINVQSKKYITVTVAEPDVPDGAVVYPVYPGTNQKIPQAKPVEILGSGEWKYTFHIFTLVHPEFISDVVDLVVGEFYKLYPVIDFKYELVVAVAPQIVVIRGSDEEILTPTLTLVDAELGIFHLNYDTCLVAWRCLCQDWPKTVTLRYSYRTSPTKLSEKAQEAMGQIRDAVAARIAADLPTYNCQCPVPYGYIMQQQTAYTDSYIAIQSGVVVDKLKYGRLHGHLYYAEVMNEAPKYKRHAEATFLL